jgi:hypothetical protein
MGRLRAVLIVVAGCVVLCPVVARAQATLAGVVRDTSGAVMPGVSVEVSSDALIDRVRTTVTDGSGQWRIVDLRPGIYVLKFSLTGFNQVVHEGVDVSGSGVITIPTELRVGNLQESITVQAETPAVDVQTAKREVVLQQAFVASLPATRNYSAILAAIPAIDLFLSTSAQTTPEMVLFSARGGSSFEGRMQIDGMTVAAAFSGGGVSSFTYNTADTTEMQVTVSGGLGESETGGPVMNLIPKSGGNTFAGSAFWSGAGDWSRSENINDELRSFGITRGPALKNSWDVSGSLGGPIKRDRLWFYGTVRNFGSGRVVENAASPNLFAGDPAKWDYTPDRSIDEILNSQSREVYSGRLTGQLGKHRLSFSQENQYRCDGSTRTPQGEGCRTQSGSSISLGSQPSIFGYQSPEAHAGYFTNPYYLTQATWTMPMTNKLLLEAGYSRFAYRPVFGTPPSDGVFNLISVTEQGTLCGRIGSPASPAAECQFTTDPVGWWRASSNMTYRSVNTYNSNWANPSNFRASASYITGSHSVKLGYQGAYQISDETEMTNPSLISYRFNQRVANQFTIRLPNWQEANRTVQHSGYIQDQWTMKRLTVQGAIRYDHAYSWSPAEHNGTTETSRWNAQPITFPRTVSVRGFDDITPRFGAAYDLFGTGKTALKMNVGKYLDAATNDSNYTANNPSNRIQTTLNRGWTDNDGDYVVDCDILNPVAQGPTTTGHVDTCAATTGNSLRFGNTLTGLDRINPAILGGWGVRRYDWQVGAAIQQEVLPRVSVEVAYNRRWWGNYTVVNNEALGANDFETWVFTAPNDPRLPGGGGYNITEYEVKPEAASRTPSNYETFETDFGPARVNYWHGVEVTANARMRNGLTFQGGTSTGREIEDQCETYPNYTRSVVGASTRSPRNCRVVAPFQTTFRASSSYAVPKVDVLVSSIVRITPPPVIFSANYLVPNATVALQLGHLPAGGTATGNQTVNLIDTNQMYAEDRIYLVDMRFAKIFRFGGKRFDIGADLYNLFNKNYATVFDGNYDAVPAAGLGPGGEWLRPTTIVQPRFVRLNVTVDF